MLVRTIAINNSIFTMITLAVSGRKIGSDLDSKTT
jgi:hypothetical protein